ncbi:hypothetical protein ACXZ66_13080 [Corynebacterium sp. S7]
MDNSNRDKPTDQQRQELQEELVQIVGRGRIPVSEFDELVTTIWSTDDPKDLALIRYRYLGGPEVEPDSHEIEYVAPQPGTAKPIKVNWELKRTGTWTVPKESFYEVKGGTLLLDFREASFESLLTKIHINATWMATVEVIVLPEFGVADNTDRKWWSDSNAFEPRKAQSNYPTIIIEGAVVGGSQIRINTKGPKKRLFVFGD